MMLSHQVGPSINEIVPSIHDGHLKKKKFRSLAPLVQILLASIKFGFRGQILMHMMTEIRENHESAIFHLFQRKLFL